jgi:hypothetical protein
LLHRVSTDRELPRSFVQQRTHNDNQKVAAQLHARDVRATTKSAIRQSVNHYFWSRDFFNAVITANILVARSSDQFAITYKSGSQIAV